MANVSSSSSSSGGLGFFGALTLLFIALKLLGIIEWSWWLVLLPLYGGFALVFGICFLVVAGIAISEARRPKIGRR